MINNNKVSSEAWAVVDENGDILYTRGGSSTSTKMMVYETEGKARGALKNTWIKQVHDGRNVSVIRIYFNKNEAE